MKKTIFAIILAALTAPAFAGQRKAINCSTEGDGLGYVNVRGAGLEVAYTLADADEVPSVFYQLKDAELSSPDTSTSVYVGTSKDTVAFGGGLSDSVILILDRSKHMGFPGSFFGMLSGNNRVYYLTCRDVI